MNKVFIYILFLFILISTSQGIILKGKIKSFSPIYKYIGKFCFEKDGGTINVNVDWDDNHHTALYLYSDYTDNIINEIKKSSCEHGVIQPAYSFNSTSNYSKNYTVMGQRDRYWYFVFVDCTPGRAVILNYEITLKNQGDSFDSNISADQQSIPQAHFFFMTFYGLLMIILTVWTHLHERKGSEIRVFFYILIILLLMTTSLIIHCISWDQTLRNKSINKSYVEVANWIGIIATNAFYLLLILIGSGWSTSAYFGTIVKPKLHFILIFITTAVSLAMSNISNLFSSDIDNYIYFLDSIPGYLVLVVYFIITIYFVTCNTIHYRQLTKPEDETKRRFFKLFTPLFAIFFFSPIVVVICSHFIEPWNRYKTIVILNLCINTLYLLILIIMFRPFKNPLIQLMDIVIELKETKNDNNTKDIETKNNNDISSINNNNNNNTNDNNNNNNNNNTNNIDDIPFEKGESNKKHKYSKELN